MSRLSFADGQMSANGGCNSIGANYSLDGDVLVAVPLALTKMACTDPDAADLERAVVATLAGEVDASIEANTVS